MRNCLGTYHRAKEDCKYCTEVGHCMAVADTLDPMGEEVLPEDRTINPEKLEFINKAIGAIVSGLTNRVDSKDKKTSVYAVKNVIRIDLK